MTFPSRPVRSWQAGGVERPFDQVPLTTTASSCKRDSKISIALLRGSAAPQDADAAMSTWRSKLAVRRKVRSNLATGRLLDLSVEARGETFQGGGAILQHFGSLGRARIARYLEGQNDRLKVFEPNFLFYE